MPQLSSLDISGTNLAGTGTFEYDNKPNLSPKLFKSESDDDEDEADRAQGGPGDGDRGGADVGGGGGGGPMAMPQCDIPGLMSRVDRPLNFLGLYKTSNDACYRAHIPALVVSAPAGGARISLFL